MNQPGFSCLISARGYAAFGLAITMLVLVGCASNNETTRDLKTGAEVYAETCFACHGTGVLEAPRYQDAVHWEPLLQEGQIVLSAHGWVGLGNMPPQGGNPNLSLEEFSRAVAHMGRGVGVDWADPTPEMLDAIREEIFARRKELAKEDH